MFEEGHGWMSRMAGEGKATRPSNVSLPLYILHRRISTDNNVKERNFGRLNSQRTHCLSHGCSRHPQVHCQGQRFALPHSAKHRTHLN